MDKHTHIITFRGCLDVNTYNGMLKLLSNNKIPYKTYNTYSLTRDDAGLLKYYDRIIFEYDKYIPYKTNKRRITRQEFLELLNKG